MYGCIYPATNALFVLFSAVPVDEPVPGVEGGVLRQFFRWNRRSWNIRSEFFALFAGLSLAGLSGDRLAGDLQIECFAGKIN